MAKEDKLDAMQQDLQRLADYLASEMAEAYGTARFIQRECGSGDGREAISNMPLRLRGMLQHANQMREKMLWISDQIAMREIVDKNQEGREG